ncbi:hypothetical protein [Campylobacter sp. CCUG 57310]|uniref:hypothetical protein n=1 Tax=Campylobacter sp. CCUG 57310 TaxID=2517362 RepID=UPI00156333B1|nr:hypothetical protein [Campylobacter sp. CCUG 57310]QKF91757.1 hypothetical protein CORI_0533 [Campylobacter sp. CCUG 57310]
MELTKQEFDVAYTLITGLVRSSASGKFEGNDYSSSVRITSANVYDVKNEKTGFIDDVEQKVVFKLICPDNTTAGLVANAIKEKLKKGPIAIKGGLPNDQKVITITDPIEYFLYETKPDKKPKDS